MAVDGSEPKNGDAKLVDDTVDKAEQEFDSKGFLKHLTGRPGVYRMINAAGKVIYVGKAKNLKKRVSSYFSKDHGNTKTAALVGQIRDIEIIITRTANEALILESNLIKDLQPRYNILMRDDKSYPYIRLSTEHDYPALSIHRGKKNGKSRYFGPYPSAGAVRDSLYLMQKIIPVRQCSESYFRNRSRPCLQHQIKRCSAPCVGEVTDQDYAADVELATLFLTGKSQLLLDQMAERMAEASADLDFERAAGYRDKVVSLRRVQEKQFIDGSDQHLDVLAAVSLHGVACIQLFMVRDGRNLGNRTFFPKFEGEEQAADVLAAFIAQHYLEWELPNELLVNLKLEDVDLLAEALGEQAGRKIKIRRPQRGDRKRWIELAEANAEEGVNRKLVNRASIAERYERLRKALNLPSTPKRLECFDISHTMGEATVASCVVIDLQGPLKSDYRRFNISGITPGDDYAAMEQALRRRYSRLKKGEAAFPDVLFIDGGKGQLSRVAKVLDELEIKDLCVIGVSKGPERKAGEELLHRLDSGEEFQLSADSPALHLIQHIRDESHRFAITGHRERRRKRVGSSPLEQIPGLGPKKRQSLLTHFGGLQEVKRAGKHELLQVTGINQQLAELVYDRFHGGD
ncbi:MAG: excinuclease ABC subunit UvrC [Immundisolibacteraceae bacterium]|nr:excinuclease ABC subunit UvrC [Immundisolibacteraceae bacterium]